MSELSTFEAEILLFIVDRRHVSVLDVINAFDPQARCRETEALLKSLAKSGFINIDWNRTCHALPEASHALSMYNDARKQHAEDKAEKDKDRQQIMIEGRKNRKHNLLIAIFSFFAGIVSTLFVEHFDEIIAFIQHAISK